MESYYSSNPEVVGYIERMHMIWKEKGVFDVKEQRLLIRSDRLLERMHMIWKEKGMFDVKEQRLLTDCYKKNTSQL